MAPIPGSRRLFQLDDRGPDPATLVEQELELHIEQRAAELERYGMTPANARAAAEKAFGNRRTIQRRMVAEARRVARIGQARRWFDDWRVDCRAALRSIRRGPGLAAAAAVALALGTAAPTTIFSIASGVLRDLPVPAARQLVHLSAVDRREGRNDLPLRTDELLLVRDRARGLRLVAAYAERTANLGADRARAERVSAAAVTAETFATLGVGPALGREFARLDESHASLPVVIIGDRLWAHRYRSSPAAIGSTIRVDGTARTIVGVMPPDFQFPRTADLWLPVTTSSAAGSDTSRRLTGIARLDDEGSLERAAAEIAVLGREAVRLLAADGARFGLALRPYHEQMVPNSARLLFRAMILVVSFVLFIACANVANLLLARTVARQREVAVLASLGASRARLIRAALIETTILSAAGGAIGVGLAVIGVEQFDRAVRFELSYWMRLTVDGTVLGFALGLTAVSTLLAGLAPARQAALINPAAVLHDSPGRRLGGLHLGRVSRASLGLEIALATALLVVSGLMITGAARAIRSAPVERPDRVAVVSVALGADRYGTPAAQVRLLDRIVHEAAGVPGVGVVAAASHLPGLGSNRTGVAIEGEPRPAGERPSVRLWTVSSQFFRLVGRPVLQGREFTEPDRAGAPLVVVVNRSFARRFFSDRDPLGQRISIDDGETRAATIVGIAPDLGFSEGNSEPLDGLYLPLGQVGGPTFHVMARATADPVSIRSALADVVAGLDPDVPILQTSTLAAELERATAGERVFTGLFAAFGGSGLVLASLGLYAVIAFQVRQRRREIAVRRSLGEPVRSIVWRMAREGTRQVGVGLAAGLGLAFLIAPSLGLVLFGADPRDPRVYAGVALVIGATALLAVLLPAGRAARVEPATLLRAG